MGESDEKRSNSNDLLARQRGANVCIFSRRSFGIDTATRSFAIYRRVGLILGRRSSIKQR